MLNFKGMRFPIDVILVCIRWYAAYPLSYRHLEEIMEERGVSGFCRISECLRAGRVNSCARIQNESTWSTSKICVFLST